MGCSDRDYEDFVGKLCKPGADIKEALTPQQAHVWHMATGVAGEAGELLDAAKRWCINQKSLDMENVIEELGDIEFYAAGVRQALGITRQEVLEYNQTKLRKRYKLGYYTDGQAIARADKS